jgi:hypothetical protein
MRGSGLTVSSLVPPGVAVPIPPYELKFFGAAKRILDEYSWHNEAARRQENHTDHKEGNKTREKRIYVGWEFRASRVNGSSIFPTP